MEKDFLEIVSDFHTYPSKNSKVDVSEKYLKPVCDSDNDNSWNASFRVSKKPKIKSSAEINKTQITKLNKLLAQAISEIFNQVTNQTEITAENITSRAREVENNWLRNNTALLNKNKGVWFGLNGSDLIIIDKSLEKVIAVSEKKGIKTPFVYYSPTDDELDSFL